MKKIVYILLIIVLLGFSTTQKHTDISITEEFEIINSVLPHIYSLDRCNFIRNDFLLQLQKTDSLRYQKYRKRCFISLRERDTIKKFVTFNTDSLVKLDISKRKKYILSHFEKSSFEYDFFNSFNKTLKPIPLNSENITQNNIEFLTKAEAKQKGYPSAFGKQDTILNVGIMAFSRVFYSSKMNLGFFEYGYLGGGTCGYTGYILFTKENNTWKYKQTINTGDF